MAEIENKDKRQHVAEKIQAYYGVHDEEENQIYAMAFNVEDGCWENLLDEREEKELAFAQIYARDFSHGTAGHNRLMLIAKLAKILDCYENVVEHSLNGN